jgi:fucose permease
LELIVLVFAFRYDDGPAYNEEKRRNQEQSSPSSGFGVVVLKYAAVWLCSLYLLAYVGTETSISGWVIVFMRRVRHSSSFVASLCSSGFWTGMAVGRISLGALSDRFGVKTSVTVYTSFTLLFAILFGVSQNDAMSVSTISLLGLFCGPLFPSSIVLLTAALPSELHVPGVSFVASVGQVGGTLMPFGIGLIVDAVGMAAFQAIFLIQLVVSLFLWVLYSRLV